MVFVCGRRFRIKSEKERKSRKSKEKRRDKNKNVSFGKFVKMLLRFKGNRICLKIRKIRLKFSKRWRGGVRVYKQLLVVDTKRETLWTSELA